MKKILLLIFLLYSVLGYSQTVTVVDKTTLKPLYNVSISAGTGLSLTTDINGKADISKFKNESAISFSTTSYAPEVLSYSMVESFGFYVALSEKSYTTDEIIVSANRFNENQKDVPREILVLNEKDIKYLNVQNTGDLLEKTGGIFVQKSQLGGGSPILRGFEASRILIVIDGVRLNNAIFRAGHLQNVLRIDNNVIDRIELLFGSGSLMYGSDALGGVLSFYTRNPILSNNDNIVWKGDAFGRYSTADNEKTGHLNVNIGGKKFGFFGSFTYSSFGDLRMGDNYDITTNEAWKRRFYTERVNGTDLMITNDDYNIQKQTGYNQYDILGKLLFKQSENVKHTFNFQFSNTNDIPRYDRLNTIGGSGKFSYAQWYYGPETRLMGSYKLDLKNEKSFYDNAQIIAAYQNIKESRVSRRFGNVNLVSQNEKVDVFTLNLDMFKKLKSNELRYGIEGTYNKVNSTASSKNINTNVESPSSTRYPDGGSYMYSMAGYFSHSWEINNQFVLSDGLRLSYVALNSKFNDTTFYNFPFKEADQKNIALTGQLGLVYMPTSDWRFYINGATGFRAPDVDDLTKVFETVKGTATTLGSVIVPNPDLKPEYTYTGEFGISKIFDNRIKLEGVAFATWFKNAITSGPSTFNGLDTIMYQGYPALVSANQNADKGAYILGYTLGLSADLTSYLSLTSSVSFTYGRIKTDSTDYPLDHIPPVIGKASLILNLDKFKGDFSILYNGWKHVWDYNMLGEDNFADATPNGMPGWYTLNLSGAYQFTPNFQLQARLDNILDKNYRSFASGMNAPGRNFVITFRTGL
ncbi:MAG TPA: TonB-dependent receptor [Ignavibacteria bacterium]